MIKYSLLYENNRSKKYQSLLARRNIWYPIVVKNMNPIPNQAPIFPSKIYIHNIHRIQRLYYFGILLKRLFEIFKEYQ